MSSRSTPASTPSGGGDGADTIFATDGRKDFIDCGRGNDTVAFDQGKDVLRDCENRFPAG